MALTRDPASHKGDNGKVAVIGGSRHQHGAPLFAALAAEATGIDLLYIFVPACHEETAKNASCNFQIHTFGTASADDHPADELSDWDTVRILEFLATMSSAVIGPGLSRSPASLKMIQRILAECPCPLVCDASALQTFTLQAVSGRHNVLTPHLGELERMKVRAEDIAQTAKQAEATIVLKGPVDQIADELGQVQEVTGGNAGLTHGGTGDCLSGIIAGLLAQGVPQTHAAVMATTLMKRAATALYEANGYAYTTMDVIRRIPALLHTLTA